MQMTTMGRTPALRAVAFAAAALFAVSGCGAQSSAPQPVAQSPSGPSAPTTGEPTITAWNAGTAPNPTGNCSVDTCYYFGAMMTHVAPGAYAWCEILHQGARYNNQLWWYRTAGVADGSGHFAGRLDGGSHGALAWSSNPFGTTPPYAKGGCAPSPNTADGSRVLTYP